MAVHLSAKPAAATQLYTWAPALLDGDTISDFTLTPTTVGIVGEKSQGGEISFFVSGGSSGTVYQILAEVETGSGESLTETLYIPVFGPGNAFSDTAQDVIRFALRPVTGLSDTPESAELDDGLEWLNAMLASWRTQGADVGVALPLALSSVLYIADEYVMAVKTNLRLLLAEQYGRQVAPTTAALAMRGLQQIKFANLPEDRAGAEYF
jgi:hypothetical protein